MPTDEDQRYPITGRRQVHQSVVFLLQKQGQKGIAVVVFLILQTGQDCSEVRENTFRKMDQLCHHLYLWSRRHRTTLEIESIPLLIGAGIQIVRMNICAYLSLVITQTT